MYQGVLAMTAMALLSTAGLEVRFTKLDMHEPVSVGLFAAMCLASRRAPQRIRLRALAIGAPTLVVLTLLMIVVAVVGEAPLRAGRGAGPMLGLISYVIDTVQWASAPVLWVVLLGNRELSLPSGVDAGRAARRRRDKADQKPQTSL